MFFRAFVDKTVSAKEKQRLLKKACENHQILYKDAMNGKGIDRHLFALYVVSRGLNVVCILFLVSPYFVLLISMRDGDNKLRGE